MLYIVDAKYFYAGFVTSNGKVTKAAPILRKHVMGKSEEQALAYIRRKGWKLIIPDHS